MGRRNDRRKRDSGIELLCEAACGSLATSQVDGVGLYCSACVEEIERRIDEREVRALVARRRERRLLNRGSGVK